MQAGILYAQDTFFLPAHPPIAAISSVEYFFDTDPGFGAGNHFEGTISGSALSIISNESIASLSQGAHKLHVRVQDTAGSWSMTQSRFLYMIDPLFSLPTHAVPGSIDKFEYFLNADPGMGNGNVSEIPASSSAALANIPIDIAGLSSGVHLIHVRFRDTSGVWSLTTERKLALVSIDIGIPDGQVADSVTAMEYFFDEDPGAGNAILIPVPATTNLENYTFTADISMLTDGMHHLFIRTLSGRSQTIMHGFEIGEPLQLKLVTFSTKQTGDDANLSWHTKDEISIDNFIVESSSDGKIFIPFDTIDARNMEYSAYTCVDRGLGRYSSERIYYRLKIIEADGRHSYAPVVPLSINVQKSFVYPNPFFKDLQILPGRRLGSGVLSVKILDMSGRCVYNGNVTGGHSFTASPGELQPGNYFLFIESETFQETFLLTRD